MTGTIRRVAPAFALAVFLSPALSLAADPAPARPDDPAPVTAKAFADQNAKAALIANTVWALLTGFLVFWMNAGFALVETGFCRAKNATNILAKNFIVFAIATIAFWISGFGLMFADGGFVGLKGFFFEGNDATYAGMAHANVDIYAKFFFQLVFAGTAATIVSGAVAERIHFNSFLVFSFIIGGLFYPITGHWIWAVGDVNRPIGWLARMGFSDFAGSTVVHSVGGWAALAGILVLGPRIGKFGKDGSAKAIPGHSMALATLGALILWLGWFGFNPGSTLDVSSDGAVSSIGRIALTTNLAAAAGMLSACAVSYLIFKKPDLGMLINGTLAGLVAITAPCAYVTNLSAVVIGLASGALVVFGVLFFDRIRIDDPVGALSVHLLNGVFGTIAVGLFAVKDLGGITRGGLFTGGGTELLVIQLEGVVAVGAFTFGGCFLAWRLIKAVIGLRVAPEDEEIGLDLAEMGMPCYPSETLVAPRETRPIPEERIREVAREVAAQFLNGREAPPAVSPAGE